MKALVSCVWLRSCGKRRFEYLGCGTEVTSPGPHRFAVEGLVAENGGSLSFDHLPDVIFRRSRSRGSLR